MVTADELGERASIIAESADLSALRDAMRHRSARVLAAMPPVPEVKALLSRDGGACPDDGAPLLFDPWAPDAHRCSRCRREFSGERHHRHWARFQHLWLAEQAAELAALAAAAGMRDAAPRANAILTGYAHYASLPNSDNVLGPSHLFFSTYLESIWITNYLGAATLLREADLLEEETAVVVNGVADEAAGIIGEFNEGFSNRQTWHNAALAAIGVWFEDEELAGRAVEGDTGMLSHLAHGFASDGTWHEGENYHLFALQGMLTAIRWARSAGVDALGDADLAARLFSALRVPMLTALPDLTFPARKDSRYGVSLAQPMYLELWERGLGVVGGRVPGAEELGGWLRALYAAPAPPAQPFDSWLYEAGMAPPARRDRSALAWSALLEMMPALPDFQPARGGSVLLPSDGYAVLRSGDRYVGLECGEWSGGHGHPDRLNLTFHAEGISWLPDFGTGSYVSPDLFWYRSTLAHNAPRLDGVSQQEGDAECTAFDVRDQWAWARGVWGPLTRTAVAGPAYVLDVLELNATTERLVELPWHLDGGEMVTPGSWAPAAFDDAFVSDVERFTPAGPGSIAIRADRDGRTLTLHLAGGTELLRGSVPGAPGATARRTFFLERLHATGGQLVHVLAAGEEAVRGVRAGANAIEIETPAGTEVHAATAEGWAMRGPSGEVRLGGVILRRPDFEPLVTRNRPLVEHATARYATASPSLDGSRDGFPGAPAIHLDHEDQYRRSEEPFAGPEAFSASAWLAWDEDALYLAVEVSKPELVFRPADAPPLRFDNEVDDIHSDGLQVYLAAADGGSWGVLVVPEAGGGIRVHPIAGTLATPAEVRGAWEETAAGYRVTLALAPAFWDGIRLERTVAFDLIVNEMRPGRERRAGQMVWTGGGGWVWLRGDRQGRERFGVLDLA